jgi:hypothetical protein
MTTASVGRAYGCVAVAILLCASIGLARAQVRYLVEEPGVWKPAKPFTAIAIASTRTDRGARFFNAAAARSAAQVIIVGSIARCFDNQPAKPNPWGCTANRQLLETLDKQAVLSLLK